MPGRTPHDFPGELLEEAITLDPTFPATNEGEIRYDPSGSFSMYDSEGEFNPRSGTLSIEQAGDGISIVSGVINVDENQVPFLSGAVFSGPVTANLTGSLTQLPDGNPFIIGQGAISVTTGSSGEVIISGSGLSSGGADVSASYILATATGSLPNSRVLVGEDGIIFTDNTTNITASVDDNIIPFLTGATFSGEISGPSFSGSLTGSHTEITPGVPAFTSISGTVDIATGSNGQVNFEVVSSLPKPDVIGQVLMALTTESYARALPITTQHGWIATRGGYLIVSGTR